MSEIKNGIWQTPLQFANSIKNVQVEIEVERQISAQSPPPKISDTDLTNTDPNFKFFLTEKSLQTEKFKATTKLSNVNLRRGFTVETNPNKLKIQSILEMEETPNDLKIYFFSLYCNINVPPSLSLLTVPGTRIGILWDSSRSRKLAQKDVELRYPKKLTFSH
jgi:hypothetical protein